MLHDAKRTEQLIIGINQSGANCGIHLIVSTQLITKEVVTPTIRVQFPTRIAFSLLSTSESRLLIGNGEANKIFESGDCILMNNGHQQKIHCPFISDIQILNTINEIRKQEGRYIPDYLPSEEDTYINDSYDCNFDVIEKFSVALNDTNYNDIICLFNDFKDVENLGMTLYTQIIKKYTYFYYFCDYFAKT